MAVLILYSTGACHLCEQALALTTPLLGDDWELREVDIADDDGLMARYGLTIPVLRREDSGAELNWPFGPEQVAGLLAA